MNYVSPSVSKSDRTPLLVPILSHFGADINLTITLILNSWNFTADHVGGRKRRR